MITKKKSTKKTLFSKTNSFHFFYKFFSALFFCKPFFFKKNPFHHFLGPPKKCSPSIFSSQKIFLHKNCPQIFVCFTNIFCFQSFFYSHNFLTKLISYTNKFAWTKTNYQPNSFFYLKAYEANKQTKNSFHQNLFNKNQVL